MQKTHKIVCCYCGHIHKQSYLDEPLEKCLFCNAPLSDDAGWISHAVRIFIEDADPVMIKRFITEVQKKKTRFRTKKKGLPRKKSHATSEKVA